MSGRIESMFERAVRASYPDSFGSGLASEMAGVFGEGLADARVRGRMHALRFVAREALALLEGALVAQADDGTPRSTRTGRALAAFARLLDAPVAPVALALAALVGVGALAGDLVAARGLYWRATQLALLVVLAGSAFRAGAAIVRDPRAIARSLAIAGMTALACGGIFLVAAVDEAVTLVAAAAGDTRLDASLPGLKLRVATGDAARAGNVEPPAGFAPTRMRSQSIERDGIAVRTQLFARGVDLAYILAAMALLGACTALGARLARHRPRLA